MWPLFWAFGIAVVGLHVLFIVLANRRFRMSDVDPEDPADSTPCVCGHPVKDHWSVKPGHHPCMFGLDINPEDPDRPEPILIDPCPCNELTIEGDE